MSGFILLMLGGRKEEHSGNGESDDLKINLGRFGSREKTAWSIAKLIFRNNGV